MVPLIRTLRRAWPDVAITWILGKGEAKLMEGLDGVELLVFDKGAGMRGVLALRKALAGRVSVFIGHSGVGKSTLVNALVPGTGRITSHVNEVTGRGRHTSTSALAIELEPTDGGDGGWIIDTPGFRSFGLAHVQVDDVLRAFPDLDDATRDCPRGCTHAATEPECALDLAVAAGTLPTARVESFRRIVAAKDTSAW